MLLSDDFDMCGKLAQLQGRPAALCCVFKCCCNAATFSCFDRRCASLCSASFACACSNRTAEAGTTADSASAKMLEGSCSMGCLMASTSEALSIGKLSCTEGKSCCAGIEHAWLYLVSVSNSSVELSSALCSACVVCCKGRGFRN